MQFKKNDIVKDEQGNHYRFIRKLGGPFAEIESVATKELFTAPINSLESTDREVF